MHVEHPAHPTPAVPTALGRTRFPVQEGRSPCRIPEKSLIILGISFGERSGYISVFQSSQQSKTHCCTLQVPELWKSRQSPTKLNRIMSTVLRVAHTPEAHRCLPARNSDGC